VNIAQINFAAVFAAALAAFILGAVWYSPLLFVNAWINESGVKIGEIKKAKMLMSMVFGFLLTLVMSFNLAAFLSAPDTTFVRGIIAGALAGIGWVAAGLGMIYLYEGKSLKLFFINAGYLVSALIVMGGILGAWR
jgi:hypothetical protein